MKTPRRGQKPILYFFEYYIILCILEKTKPHALEHTYFLSSNLKTNNLAVGASTVHIVLILNCGVNLSPRNGQTFWGRSGGARGLIKDN